MCLHKRNSTECKGFHHEKIDPELICTVQYSTVARTPEKQPDSCLNCCLSVSVIRHHYVHIVYARLGTLVGNHEGVLSYLR